MFVSFFACSICREHNVILLSIQSYNVNSIALISFCNDFLFVSFFPEISFSYMAKVNELMQEKEARTLEYSRPYGGVRFDCYLLLISLAYCIIPAFSVNIFFLSLSPLVHVSVCYKFNIVSWIFNRFDGRFVSVLQKKVADLIQWNL